MKNGNIIFVYEEQTKPTRKFFDTELEKKCRAYKQNHTTATAPCIVGMLAANSDTTESHSFSFDI